jgi:dTMP kinase
MTPPRLIVVLSIMSLAAAPASAQDVQRCEDASGKVSYANGQCPQGTTAVRTLPPAATPSAADRKAAQQRAQQDTRDAAALDRARQAEEQRIAREQEQAQAKAKKQEAQCRRLETRLRQEQNELAIASSNKRAEAQRRVRRAEQAYAEECGPLK